MLEIVFRADASGEIGAGHVMRCLTLADALRQRGANCRFVCRERRDNLEDLVRQRGFEFLGLPKLPVLNGPDTVIGSRRPPHAAWLGTDWVTDTEQTRAVLGGAPIDWIVVDHYAIDAKWERAMRSSCRKVMVVDDLADRRHDCDVLVDPGLAVDLESKYRQLTPGHCILYIGPRYVLLRPEFEIARASLMRRGDSGIPRRLVVGFGGSDAEQSTLEALNAIRKTAPEGTLVDVIVSIANQTTQDILEFCSQNAGFSTHVATDQIASIFAKADLAVGSGGGVTWERLYLRLPSLLKIIAENQRGPLENLREIRLIDLYSNEDELIEKLNFRFKNGVELPADVVANGVPRICDALVTRMVSLRHPTPYDVRRSFYWLQDGNLRRDFLMPLRPERAIHFDYWRNLLRSDCQKVFSVISANEHVGNAGIKNIDRAKGEAELWLYIGHSAKRGQGLGKMILQQLEHCITQELNCGKAVLHVSLGNSPAITLYKRAGYACCLDRSPSEAGFQADHGVVRMEKTL